MCLKKLKKIDSRAGIVHYFLGIVHCFLGIVHCFLGIEDVLFSLKKRQVLANPDRSKLPPRLRGSADGGKACEKEAKRCVP
jgi:hypothetical protein